MADTLPDPLVPSDVDLRGMGYMPLHGDRLFGSATWIGATAEAKVAALKLWWRSFAHEIPAASLPDDDTLLSEYAGYGVAVKAWRKVRPQAMRGWVKCSDGRLYHKVVAEIAMEAWEARKRNREKQARWRDKNRKVTPAVTVTNTVRGPSRNAGSEVKVSEGKEGVTTTESVADNARPRATQPADGLDPPQFLRRPRAVLIPDDWQPSENALMNLRKGRPDLVGKLYDDRMQDFREWCRANAVTSHDPEASWSSFMRKTRTSAPAGETHDQRRIREAREAIAS